MLELAVESSVVLALTLVGVASMRGASAAWRHHVLAVGLLAVLALPALRAVLPPLPVRGVAPAPVAMEDAPRDPIVASSSTAMPRVEATTRRAHATPGPSFDPGRLALGLWMLGALLMLARLGVSHLRASRLARGEPAPLGWRATRRARRSSWPTPARWSSASSARGSCSRGRRSAGPGGASG